MSFPFLRNKQAQSPNIWSACLQRFRSSMNSAAQLELYIVQQMSLCTRSRLVRSLAIFINTLGNGWIYLPLVGLIILADVRAPSMVIFSAALAAAIAHLFHHVLKRSVCRLRPFERHPMLPSLCKVLDKYSFPSGHCMTLTAALIPIVYVMPVVLPVAVGAITLLGCCRMIAAHHYPSDVLAGVALGASVAIPVSMWLLQA